MVSRVTRSPGGVFRRSAGGVRGGTPRPNLTSGRAHSLVSYGGYLWTLGVNTADNSPYKYDGRTYKSQSGRRWTYISEPDELSNTDANSPRPAVSFDGYIYSMQHGVLDDFYNWKIHKTTDCENFTQVLPAGGFVKKFAGNFPAGTYSSDGEVKINEDHFSASGSRTTACVFDGKLWFYGRFLIYKEWYTDPEYPWLPPVYHYLEEGGYCLQNIDSSGYYTFVNNSDTIGALCAHGGNLWTAGATPPHGGTLYAAYSTNGETWTDASDVGIDVEMNHAQTDLVSFGGNLYLFLTRYDSTEQKIYAAVYDGASWSEIEMQGIPWFSVGGTPFFSVTVHGDALALTYKDILDGDVIAHTTYVSSDGETWTRV